MIVGRIVKITLFLTAIILGLFSCATQKQAMTYLYTDQNNNQYNISASEIRYNPIEPSESSSGTYSGDEKITLKITPEAFKEISKQADALLLTSKEFTSARRMLTAIISVTKGGKTKKGILKPSDARIKFEVLLKQTLH